MSLCEAKKNFIQHKMYVLFHVIKNILCFLLEVEIFPKWDHANLSLSLSLSPHGTGSFLIQFVQHWVISKPTFAPNAFFLVEVKANDSWVTIAATIKEANIRKTAIFVKVFFFRE